MDESPLVRLHFIIGRNEGPLPQVDVRELEQQIAALLDHLGRCLWPRRCAPPMAAAKARPGWPRWRPRFSPGYRDAFPGP